jgi:hypothetical protein
MRKVCQSYLQRSSLLSLRCVGLHSIVDITMFVVRELAWAWMVAVTNVKGSHDTRMIAGGGHCDCDHRAPEVGRCRDRVDKRGRCSLSSQRGRKERWTAFTMLWACLDTAAHDVRLATRLVALRCTSRLPRYRRGGVMGARFGRNTWLLRWEVTVA